MGYWKKGVLFENTKFECILASLKGAGREGTILCPCNEYEMMLWWHDNLNSTNFRFFEALDTWALPEHRIDTSKSSSYDDVTIP